MINQKFIYTLLIIGLSFGTAWAVRGKFGHEQGAAWAGAIGALTIIILANRSDWYNRVFKIMLAAAFGWGIGGIISYGQVVGYGRGPDFFNVWYGFLMLLVIGGLYGFLGGGSFGLALSDTEEHPVQWSYLIIELTTWALIVYGFLINQLGWLMTPPRSELWAACLGMSIGLTWFMVRHQHFSALKVAGFSALGAGFGFAFGNFLQVMGNQIALGINFWNVMEYSIGFFGGLGMAYGTFTSHWPFGQKKLKKSVNLAPIFILFFLIPFVIWEQSFTYEKVVSIAEGITKPLVLIIRIVAITVMVLMGLFVLNAYQLKIRPQMVQYGKKSMITLLLVYLGVYIFLSFLITGTGFYRHLTEQYLYLVNYGVIAFGILTLQANFATRKFTHAHWIFSGMGIILLLALLAWIAIQSHGEWPGSHVRFE